MSDDKTPTEAREAKPAASPTNPVSSADEEPKQTNAKSAGAKPATRKIAHNAVVGAGDTDPIRYSSAKPSKQKKVLTILHVQRALSDLGFAEAASAPGGTYEALTTEAIKKYQTSRTEDATGVLTRDQFSALFEGDPNVTVTLDTHTDHTV